MVHTLTNMHTAYTAEATLDPHLFVGVRFGATVRYHVGAKGAGSTSGGAEQVTKNKRNLRTNFVTVPWAMRTAAAAFPRHQTTCPQRRYRIRHPTAHCTPRKGASAVLGAQRCLTYGDYPDMRLGVDVQHALQRPVRVESQQLSPEPPADKHRGLRRRSSLCSRQAT